MSAKLQPSRYRIEGDQICIDIRLRSARQIFDGRDPAPFRERDLDQNAVDYIYSAAEVIAVPKPLKLVLFLEEPIAVSLSVAEIETAIRAHFEHEREQVNRRLRQQRRFGQVALAVGLSVLVGFLTLAEMVQRLPIGHAGDILREGLVITGWVAMWRPIEVLLYDWGGLFVAAGIVMLFVPGQGILTILIGLSLLDLPGKRDLERRLVGSPAVFEAINGIRARAGRPPLRLE